MLFAHPPTQLVLTPEYREATVTRSTKISFYGAAILLSLGACAVAFAQTPANRVGKVVNESQTVTLYGNTHPLARSEFDQGAVDATTPMGRMVLQLEPSASQSAALEALIEAQHDPQSPLYHQWLTPAQYGARFGASVQDVTRISAWLASHGFTVDEIPASNRQIVFSGSATQVAETFHAEMHHYLVNGAHHFANAQDPQIPAALAGVVSGVVSLHDFRRDAAVRSRVELNESQGETLRSAQAVHPEYSSGGTHYLFPADWATIYDLNSLYKAGTNGAGTSIAIVGRSNINLSDVAAFRSISALTANMPTVIYVSNNPGLLAGDQDESTLDVEWAGAVAPAATVKFVVGASTNTTDGVDLSAQYIVNHVTAPVMSTSYGSCEANMGAAELAFYNSLWQQAASEGISAFVSSGDSGAAGCYGGSSSSASGKGVNGLCSSPYATCVGGTEFNEGSNYGQYWASTNSTGDGSALSYIPETVWNESGANGGSGLWSSGGGISLVYAQPTWQKSVSGTSAANGMRAVPDVSMSASSHDGYIIAENGNYYIIAGTSAASPSFAGVMALVVQSKSGVGQGNANPGLYALLNASRNPFHATPSGNNSVPGVTGFSASGASYNLATGLGSVDGAVLVAQWGSGTSTASGIDFALKASALSATVLTGGSTSFTLSLTESGAARNAVALTATAPAGVTVTVSPASILPGATATVTVNVTTAAAVGAQNIVITGKDASGSQTVSFALTVAQPPTLTLSAAASSLTVPQGSSGAVALTATTGGSYTGNLTFSLTGLPAGVTAVWSANPLSAAAGANANKETLTLTASATATASTVIVPVTVAGDGLTATSNVTLTVQAVPAVQLSVTPGSVSMQSLATATATVTATPLGGLAIQAGAAGSTIAVASGLPAGITASWSAPTITASGAVSWTLTLTGSSKAVAGAASLALSAKVVGKTGVVVTSSVPLPLVVTLTPPTLTLTPTSPTVTVVQGATATDLIQVAGNGTFSGTPAMSLSGFPIGITAVWSSNPVTLTSGSGSSTLTLIAAAQAPVGTYTMTATATSGAVSTGKIFTVQVVNAPSVTLSVSPASLSVLSTGLATATVTATPQYGAVLTTAGSVLSVPNNIPYGFTASWSAPALTATGSLVWTLALSGSAAAVPTTSQMVVAVTAGEKTGTALSARLTLPVTVIAAPTLSLAAATSTPAVVQGKSVTDLFTLSGNATYSGAAALSVTGMPAGVSATWSNSTVAMNGAAGTSTLTLSATSAVSVGTYSLTVKAVGDGLTVSKVITLQVQQAPAVQLTAGALALTLSRTTGVGDAITTMSVGGLNTAVGLSVSGLPTGVSAAFSKSSIAAPGSGSATLTFTCTTAAKTGTYSVTITATPASGAVATSQLVTLTLK